MDHSPARRAPAQNRASLHQEITDRIISQLEAGCVPWVQPWAAASAPLAMPRNAATGRAYSGINILILWDAVVKHGFGAQTWLTFRQALNLGGSVRKGEHGTSVVYASRCNPREDGDVKEDRRDRSGGIPFLKRFKLFNVAQCNGLPAEFTAETEPADTAAVLPRADALIRATGMDFRIGGDRAFYNPGHDFVQVPPPSAYFEPVNWHRTALHELAHACGHASRLNRDMSGTFGSKQYAQEELVAEISAAFLCASLGIMPTVRHADYIASWLEVLRGDNRAIVRAASAASKAANYLLAFLPGESGKAQSTDDLETQEAG